MDGIRIGVRGGTGEKEAVLVATAYLENGERVLISVELGNRESYIPVPLAWQTGNSWKMFIEDMRRRGLMDPLLIITDGSPGLLRAIEEIFPGVDTL